jgi:hypothetical protein
MKKLIADIELGIFLVPSQKGLTVLYLSEVCPVTECRAEPLTPDN